MANKSFEGCKILVVGGAGFVGSNLLRELLREGADEIIVVDNLLSSEVSNLPTNKSVRFTFGSIVEDHILAELPSDLDYVFHLACFHGNQSSINDPLADHENNTLTSLKLFNKLIGFPNLKKVVYAAAACAVAEKTYEKAVATTEDQPVSLYHDSPYSISKIIGELYGNFFFQHHKLPIVKARFSNVYGPREILGAGRWRGTVHTIWRNVVPTFIWKALNGESLMLDNNGEASRDFIFVEDMARGLIACALAGKPGDVYNLATGNETTILDLATIINELTGNEAPLKLKPAREWDRSGKRFASTDKAARELGFKSQVGINIGLANTVKWSRENMDLINLNIEKHKKLVSQVSS